MPAAGAQRPNVIVFFTDQQRWDTTGAHGNPLGLTPNYDRVARSGTHAARAFTPQPVCGPARSVMMSGRYATSTGCFRNGIPLPEDVPTLAHHFRDAGYHTGYIGKWHLAADEPVPEAQRGGFQHWLAANLLEFSSDAYSTVVYDEECRAVRLPGYRVDALTDAAIRYVDAHRHEPFFSVFVAAGAAPSEPSRRLSGAGRVSRKLHWPLGAAGSGGLERLVAAASGWLLWDGQAHRRSLRTTARRAQEP